MFCPSTYVVTGVTRSSERSHFSRFCLSSSNVREEEAERMLKALVAYRCCKSLYVVMGARKKKERTT